MLNQVAIVSQTDNIKFDQLVMVSAAIQKQVSRDFGPAWNIDASVDSFQALEDVPLGYWPVIIKDDIGEQPGVGGIHKNSENGQPFALVKYSNQWPMTTSHETLEMLVDPSGNRTVATNSPDPTQGRVIVLVEVCDPSEAPRWGYSVNGVLLSDFYTPRFFDPVTASGVQYSFSGAIKKPLEVLDGGYISWWDPVTKHVFQLFVTGTKQDIVDRGSVPSGFSSLRSFADLKSAEFREEVRKKAKPRAGLMLTTALGEKKAKEGKIDISRKAYAESLTGEIEALLKRRK